MSDESGARVLVVGSANLDFIVQVAVAPRPGETVLARTMIKVAGGKGANQAVAAARMGATVQFAGCVGDDDNGELLLRALRAEGVDTSTVEIIASEPTGLALVSVFDSGENSITVIPGANHALNASRVVQVIPERDQRAVIVMQAEIRQDVIDAVSAASAGHRLVLNLAPYRHASPSTLALCDPLVVNQSEAAAMVGFPVTDTVSAEEALSILVQSARSAVITLGGDGASWAGSGGGRGSVSAPDVGGLVDTTGAGDAFVGALAAELAAGSGLGDAVRVGVLAGSYAVQRFGAQSSYPMRSDLPGVGAPAALG
jgi:ribokinase